MTVEELALQFVEFRGSVNTDIANSKNECKNIRGDISNLRSDIAALRKVKFSNGWKNRTIFTGVGALVGGGVLETLHKILEHVK